jgi:hypothetical protein
MNEEELKLRSKFYLSPKKITLEELKQMDEKYTSYPGLTLKQAKDLSEELLSFKNSLQKNGIKVIKAY